MLYLIIYLVIGMIYVGWNADFGKLKHEEPIVLFFAYIVGIAICAALVPVFPILMTSKISRKLKKRKA